MLPCDGQNNCTIAIVLDQLFRDGYPEMCGYGSVMYVQMPCTIPSQLKMERQMSGLLIGCISVFIYLFTLVYSDYIKGVQVNQFVDWDVKTITAGDFTFEFEVSEE